MFTPMQRTVVTLVTSLVMIFVFLFGGAGLTASAAQSSLPGDALYGVKTGLEKAQLSFASDLAYQAELYMRFASNRLGEMEKLIEANRYEEAVELADQFQAYIQKALEKVGALASVDPARATALSAEINERLAEFTEQLGLLTARVPASLQSGLKNALPSISGGSLSGSSSNANENTNSAEDENENGNVNDDDNANDDNSNANVNDDDNSNGDDDNGNGDDDNSNANDNGDDDENGNGDDDNGNDNGDDDTGNGDDGNGGGDDDNGGDDDTGGDDDNGGDDSGGGDDNGDGGDDSSNS